MTVSEAREEKYRRQDREWLVSELMMRDSQVKYAREDAKERIRRIKQAANDFDRQARQILHELLRLRRNGRKMARISDLLEDST